MCPVKAKEADSPVLVSLSVSVCTCALAARDCEAVSMNTAFDTVTFIMKLIKEYDVNFVAV